DPPSSRGDGASIMVQAVAGQPPRDTNLRSQPGQTSEPMIPVIYHPKSNITAFGLERLHPFDGRKYRRIHDALIACGMRKAGDFRLPPPIGREELARVHTPEYLRSLRDSKV